MNVIKSVLCQLALWISLTGILVAVQPMAHGVYQIDQHIIPNPNKNEEEIEFFIARPASDSPSPAIFLLHGHQSLNNNNGGQELIKNGYIEHFVDEGVVTVSISIRGYGKSIGKRDFGGLDSQNAVIAVINHVKKLPYIDSSKIGIYGIGRGAQLASRVSSHFSNISIQILESGLYDLVSFQSDAPHYLEGIKNNIILEAGTDLEALIERSPIYNIDNMNAATLILHGELDDRRQLSAAQKLHQGLLNRGIDSQLKIYPAEPYFLTTVDKWETIIPFIRQHFFDLYGIGLKVSKAMPAIQILKIHANSPASNINNLKVGDVILSVAPMNDSTEVSVLQMPMSKFLSLILGKKDSNVRVRVQHLDYSIEDIVIKRADF